MNRRFAIVAGMAAVFIIIAVFEYFAISFAGTFVKKSAGGAGTNMTAILGLGLSATIIVMALIAGIAAFLLLLEFVRERYW